MVYQQQPPQQYGAQQQYGQPTQAQPAYGAPASAAMVQPEIKWSGLLVGGSFKVPVVAFIGRLTAIVEDMGSQFGLRLVEKYDQVQILESLSPWPWATIDISIKYSDREESAWGRHVASAKVLGIATQAPSLVIAKAELIGKVYELRQRDETYGEDTKTGQTFHGDVWRFVRIVQPGMVQTFPQFQYPQPTPTLAPQPVYVQPQLAVSPISAPAPQPGPTPQVGSGLNLTPDPSDTAAVRAKKLLNGRALNEWLGVALIDDRIKADPAFINSVYDQSFIVGLKASGQVVQNSDGKFQVIK